MLRGLIEMGKILKYCSSCDEGFAERFTFCPTCGGPLQAFAMKPVGGETADQPAEPEVAAAAPAEPEPLVEPADENGDATFDDADVQEIEVEAAPAAETATDDAEPVAVIGDEPAAEDEPFTAPTPYYSAQEYRPVGDMLADDDGFHVTVIEEKNAKQRNSLLLGVTAFMLILAVGAWGFSLFSKSLDIGSIGDDVALLSLIDDVPMPVDDVVEQKKNNDKGGGGGGGGREEKTETSQGDLADQSRTPTRPPDAKVFRSDNFELKTPPPQTEGNMKFEKKYDRWGDPNALSTLASNGTGSGGGQGSGRGTGQGSGSGSGAGSGSGSGYGSGVGNGNGGGTGDGDDGGPPPDVPKVTTPLRIVSKPKATYTDAARTNNVQGSVRLKVTLLASGEVGSIVPVTRLPHGLTEQAIAAARLIKFEPAKVNGRPVSKTVTMDYGFNIY